LSTKPKVFVITPFDEDFLALYDELKKTFEDKFEFTNAGDLDNQQNILKDIVEGIYEAQVIIADVSGSNANVFYELGLAHAMNKKVIIITQDVNELPFDIRSYRANQYSLKFYKLQDLIDELNKLLSGAMDNTIKYGNPVFDYLPNITISKSDTKIIEPNSETEDNTENNLVEENNELDDDKGYFDYISDIEENTQKMTDEINAISEEMQEMSNSITNATNDINRVKAQSGNADVAFVRNVCRKLSSPIDTFAGKLKGHVSTTSKCWDIVENSYLSLMDNQHMRKQENLNGLHDSVSALKGMKQTIATSDGQIKNFVNVMYGSLGMERRLSKAITSLITELESYLSMTKTIDSSIDRIVSKSEIVINSINSVQEKE